MIDRIKHIIENEGISIRAFEIKISASNGLIRKAIANNSDIQSKWILPIVDNFPQYSIMWLITGKGEMLKSEPYDDSNKHNTDNCVNNKEEPYTKYDQVKQLTGIVESQQRVIETQSKTIEELTKKNNGGNDIAGSA